MVSIEKVWKRVSELAKSGTSGYDDPDEFNSKVYAAQLELFQMLVPTYGINQQADDALAPLVVRIDKISSPIGEISVETDYGHFLGIQLKKGTELYPARKLRVNEVASNRMSQIRKMKYEDNRVGYQRINNKFIMEPPISFEVYLLYAKLPPEAKIDLVPVSDDQSDYLEVSSVTDFVWPETMFNILVYMILEKLGIEMKEELLTQYALLGITKETINTNPE